MKKSQVFVPIPDSVINSALKDGEMSQSIDTGASSGVASVMTGGTMTNLNELGEARG
jgi:hypothetical protein